MLYDHHLVIDERKKILRTFLRNVVNAKSLIEWRLNEILRDLRGFIFAVSSGDVVVPYLF